MSSLEGLRVAVTRPVPQADELCDRLRELRAVPIRFPTIAVRPPHSVAPLNDALRSLDRYDWAVFTSVNGVRSVAAQAASLGMGPATFAGLSVAAVGPATARALNDIGVAVAAMPAEYLTEQIAQVIAPAEGTRVVLLRADIATAALPEQLSGMGARVDDITVYRTVCAVPDHDAMAALRAGVDVVTFTSPSTVRGFHEALGTEWRNCVGAPLIATIGPVTSAAARELDFEVGIEAGTHTIDGLLRALCDHFAAQSDSDLNA